MPAVALLLVLAAATAHATSHLFIKRDGARGGVLPFVWLTYVVTAAALAVPVTLVSRWSDDIPRSAWPWLGLSVGGEVVYIVALARAYSRAPLSQVYPSVRGTGVTLTPFVAAMLLGERPSPLGAVGIALVAVGLLGAHWTVSRADAASAAERESFLPLALVAGASMAVYATADKAALRTASLVAYLSLDIGVTAIALLPWAVAQRRAVADSWRCDRRAIVLTALAMTVGSLLALAAVRIARVGYVAAARESSILVAVFLGVRVLGERVHRSQAVGLACVVVGIGCLALG